MNKKTFFAVVQTINVDEFYLLIKDDLRRNV